MLMRTCRQWFPLGFLVVVSLVGCGGSDEETKAVTKPPEPPAPPPTVIDIVVDANRDGVVSPEDAADQERENEWSAEFGAAFLANLDDDDDNAVRDADDEVVNGATDETDLATIVVRPWPDAPEGATGAFAIDALAAENVRIFKKGLDGAWVLSLGSLGPCTDATQPCTFVPQLSLTQEEVRAGVTLGIEARRFRVSIKDENWSGMVDLSYSVIDKDGVIITTEENADGFDRAKMRVAPWMLFGNLSKLDTAYSDDADVKFTSQLAVPLEKGGMTYKKITNYSDQWVQDYFQTAWTSMPGPDGTVRGMRVFNPRPWSQGGSLPIKWLMKNKLGPDSAVVQIYEEDDTGTTYDSHGNHDLLPPYTNGAESYPHGRIILGSGVLPETREFYAAQMIQASSLRVKTSWLLVGHVDEVFSYVPAKTDRGWKLLVGSPRLAKAMLEKASMDGHGAVEMFVGKKWYTGIDAAISIDEVLASTNIMQWSQAAQTEIDAMLEDIREAVGLKDDEIIEIPYLFEDESGLKVAYNPGTANLLGFGDYVVHADPFGPQIGGVDLFKKDLEDRLGTPVNQLGSTGQGLFVNFADDWSLYHILLGEVHCASNVDGPPPANEKWWEAGK
jgi:protein-arginine deiminase